MSQIYFNKNGADLDLSEANLYNSDCGCLEGALDLSELFEQIIDYEGIVDETCFPYPTEGDEENGYCSDYENISSNWTHKVNIPGFVNINPNSNDSLKKSIMDYGPIVAHLENAFDDLHPGGPNVGHTVLIFGWDSSPLQWFIKDSWDKDSDLYSTTLDIFNFSPTFYYVDPVVGNDTIYCSDSNCNILDTISYYDNDNDGFYNWGLDRNLKPASCPGPDLMDFYDDDPNILFLIGYSPLETIPSIEGPNFPCSDSTFTIIDVPAIMNDSVSWELSPAYYFDTPRSGSGKTAIIRPTLSSMGKKCTVTFTLKYRGEVKYSMDFYPNGPSENEVSVSVLDSYGGSPVKYGDIYYLCPNTIYTITYNSSASNCSVNNFNWELGLPYGWTKYWEDNSTVSINTNEYPYGQYDIYAKTCCFDTPVKVFTQYFYEAECGGDFMAFPNPSNNFVDIVLMKNRESVEEVMTNDNCILSVIDKSGMVKLKTIINSFPYKMDTSNLPDGLYFVNLIYENRKSTLRLAIKHK